MQCAWPHVVMGQSRHIRAQADRPTDVLRTLLRTRRGVTSLNPFRTIVLVTSTYFSKRDGNTWRSFASSRVAAHDSTKGFHPMSGGDEAIPGAIRRHRNIRTHNSRSLENQEYVAATCIEATKYIWARTRRAIRPIYPLTRLVDEEDTSPRNGGWGRVFQRIDFEDHPHGIAERNTFVGHQSQDLLRYREEGGPKKPRC